MRQLPGGLRPALGLAPSGPWFFIVTGCVSVLLAMFCSAPEE